MRTTTDSRVKTSPIYDAALRISWRWLEEKGCWLVTVGDYYWPVGPGNEQAFLEDAKDFDLFADRTEAIQ